MTRSKKWTALRSMLLVVIALALAAPSVSHAQVNCIDAGGNIVTPVVGVDLPIQCGEPGPHPCEGKDPGHGQPDAVDDLCARPIYGASCVAIGVYLKVEPVPVLLPTGAKTQLSRSEAYAFGFNGFGYGHGDAAQVKQDVPGTLGAGIVESKCDAQAYTRDNFKQSWAHGRADTVRVALDLMPNYSIPLNLQFDVLCEEGTSMNGAPGPLFDSCVPAPPGNPGASATGANRADIANLIINGSAIVTAAALPNTSMQLPPVIVPGLLGTLYLNEQWGPTPTQGGCVRWDGDALRLVLRNPLTGGTVATLIISWASTCS